MKIKNFLIEKEYLDILVEELNSNNEDYVLIKCDFYNELHYKDNIYRFFDMDKVRIINPNMIEGYEIFTINNNIKELHEIDSYYKKEKKEKTGYKKLNKQLIKETNQHVKRRK